MTFNFALLDVRACMMLRVAALRVSSFLGAIFSKPDAALASARLYLQRKPADKAAPPRRYRLEITLLGRATGEQLLHRVSPMLSADGIVVHSTALNLREKSIGRLTVEVSCTCEQRARLVEFVEYASGTPGVSRVRWESIPAGH